MVIVKLDKQLGDIKVDLSKPGFSAFLGLEEMVDREVENLISKFPSVKDASEIEKAKAVFEWIIPSPDSNRYIKSSNSWIKNPIRYNSDRIFHTKTDSPKINCFGFGILGTAMSRKLGLTANVVDVDITDTGTFTPHSCYEVIVNGSNVLADPSYYKESKQKSFDAEHQRIQISKDEAVFNVVLAYHYGNQGETDKETECYEKAHELNPDSLGLLFNLADCRYGQGKKLSALEIHLKALELFPEYTDSLKEAGDIFMEFGEVDRAEEYYVRASKVKRLLLNAEVKNGRLELFTIEHPSRIESMISLARIMMDKGRPGAALNYLFPALGFKQEYSKFIAEKDADTLFDIGTCYDNKGDLKNAIKYYEMARIAEPRDMETINRLSECYAFTGKIDKALELGPTGADAFYYIGDYYERKGRLGLAKEYYEDSLKKSSKDVDILNALGSVSIDLGSNKKAREYLETALKLDPKNKEAKANLSLIEK